MDHPKTPEEIIPGLIEYIFSGSKCRNAEDSRALQWRIAIGFRRFVALAYIMRPATVAKDTPAWKIAEALGITSARFSQICGAISEDLGGLKHPSMRSDEHRQACAEARAGKPSRIEGRRKVEVQVSTVPANRYRLAEQRGIMRTFEAFQSGRVMSKKQTRLLFAAGILDSDGLVTEQGLAMLDDPAATASGSKREVQP
jgi:hypothetical protein